MVGASPAALETKLRCIDGQAYTIELPDGGVLRVGMDGNYTLDDKDAKVTYRSNRSRDFNRYLNVSDRLEEFIAFCGGQGVRQDEMLDLPIHLFVGWLIVEAAKADKEPQLPALPDLRAHANPRPRCPACRRYIPRVAARAGLDFCKPRCYEAYYERCFTEPLNQAMIAA